MPPRDSFFHEQVVWSGRPQQIKTPPIMRGFAGLLALMAVVALLFAGVLAAAFEIARWDTVAFALWCSAMSWAALHLPRWWLSGVRYVVTENHVIWQRGPFRRTIERRSISFARIFWSADLTGSGDLELVRSVPTGALRRRLLLNLQAVAAPDRVWAIVRGAEDVAPIGRGERPLTQRLDEGERVLWSARPRPRLRAYLPQGKRQWMLLTIAVFLGLVLIQMLVRGIPALGRLVDSGMAVSSFPFLALAFISAATAALLLSIAGYIVYDAIIRPGRLLPRTRYLITNRRVLIQRDNEELHLDRSKIVDVIDSPAGDGLTTLFLVLDGPRARALAAHGAFGELDRTPHLQPVLEAVQDAESVSKILRSPYLPEAA